MQFEKIAEQNAWNSVHNRTQAIRRGEGVAQGTLEYLANRGIDVAHAIFPAFGEFDTNVYCGTLISQDRRVYEFFIDLNTLEDSDLEDVTAQLGPKDPAHPDADPKELITMSLIYFDEENAAATA